jgi:hypothetical protein
MIETYYRTTIHGYTFQIFKKIDGSVTQMFILDSRGRSCIEIMLNKNLPIPELQLRDVFYKDSCSFTTPFLRGHGTIMMTKALLLFAIKTYEDYPYVTLQDGSAFDCILPDELHKISIPLHTHNFLIYGKTWYERIFGAVPESDLIRERMKESLDILNTPVNGTFSEFWTIKTDGLKPWIDAIKPKIEYMFHQSVGKLSWKDFLYSLFSKKSELSKQFSENIPCSIFKLLLPHLENYFRIPRFQASDWKITRDVIEAYPERTIHFVENNEPSRKKYRTNHTTDPRNLFLSEEVSKYTVGGRHTRKRTKYDKIPYIPRHYGGLYSYLLGEPHTSMDDRRTRKYRKSII